MKQSKKICKICGKVFSDASVKGGHLGKHVIKIHDVSLKQYYDSYYKTDKEEYCLYCDKTTKFKNITTGYNKFWRFSFSADDESFIGDNSHGIYPDFFVYGK